MSLQAQWRRCSCLNMGVPASGLGTSAPQAASSTSAPAALASSTDDAEVPDFLAASRSLAEWRETPDGYAYSTASGFVVGGTYFSQTRPCRGARHKAFFSVARHLVLLRRCCLAYLASPTL